MLDPIRKLLMDFKLVAFAVFMIGLAFLVLKDQKKVERFQSAGTLLQLGISHVPTRAELKQDRLRERRRVHQERSY